MNIPIYRAFSEVFNKYVLGVPYFSDGRYYMLIDDCNKNNDTGTGSFPIDESTLSISFSDMQDSQGNKIFASLSEDGKGGDIVKYEQVMGSILKSSGPEECIVKYCNRDHIIAPFFINAKYKNQKTYMTKEHLQVIGIQK